MEKELGNLPRKISLLFTTLVYPYPKPISYLKKFNFRVKLRVKLQGFTKKENTKAIQRIHTYKALFSKPDI
jgi:hypothetical protein